MKISMSDKIYNNLNSIYYYLSLFSFKSANKAVAGIYSRIELLKQFPDLGRYVPEILDKYLRELIYKDYRIMYYVPSKSETVFILFIMNFKQDFKSFINNFTNINI